MQEQIITYNAYLPRQDTVIEPINNSTLTKHTRCMNTVRRQLLRARRRREMLYAVHSNPDILCLRSVALCQVLHPNATVARFGNRHHRIG